MLNAGREGLELTPRSPRARAPLRAGHLTPGVQGGLLLPPLCLSMRIQRHSLLVLPCSDAVSVRGRHRKRILDCAAD